MDDQDCVRFLQWVLPRLRMRWPGFRKVRKQVCKRIQHRMNELELPDADAYRDYLLAHADEWSVVNHACRVTVSRFNRDRAVLEKLASVVLPALADAETLAAGHRLRAWSAGCAMGEEAYSLVLIWHKRVAGTYSNLDIEVTGSDIDETLLARARRACYAYSSLKALPQPWLRSSFDQQDDEYCLDPRLRSKVQFVHGDIRDRPAMGPFHIVFCRNLAFTYFDTTLQLEMLEYLRGCLVGGGALVTGGHESLPKGLAGFDTWPECRAIYRKQ